MNDNVEELVTASKENRDAAVLVLSRMLELARKGEVAAVAVAFVKKDRVSASYAWSSSDSVPALIGATVLMQQDMTAGSVRERIG